MVDIYTPEDGGADFFSDLSRENIRSSTLADEDENPEVVLGVMWQGNRIGAAYYELETEHLFLMPDHVESSPFFTVLRLLLKQIQPTCIVTSCKMDERVVSILYEARAKRSSSGQSQTSETSSESQGVILLPNIDFAYESSRHHLQSLDLTGMPAGMSDAERRIFLSSLVDFKSVCMVKAAGGLLKFVRQKTLCERAPVSAISSFSLQNIVNVDENTYRVLQIFQDERHPSVYKSADGIKEGLSLYGICNKCRSSLGRKELRRWFLLPTNDPSVLQERQATVHFFSLAKNLEIVNALQGSLKHVKYLPTIFLRMKTAQASMNDWKTLYKTSYHAAIIGEICRAHASALEIFRQIGSSFSADMLRVASLLDKVIDFDEYARQNHFAVKAGVDSEIDKMKRIYHGLPDFMTQVAHQELQDLDTDIQQCSVIYLPQLGYLLTVPMSERMRETKDYSLPDLRFMFVLNDTVHYKSARTRNLDSLLGDTLCDIYDKETQVMHRLQNTVLEVKGVFSEAMDLLARLDCLISLAVASREYNWVQPEMTTDGTFSVLKARHPLQELCVPCFVPNDVFSGGGASRIKVLTGPNSSGKSTYLKQVALISFLAHVGCFVPARSALVPLLDSIFSCIENVESVSINLSSFLISVKQLSVCLNRSSSNSLVVVDEFGKHTEGASGLALLVSALRHWLRVAPSPPHVFLATHYLSLSGIVSEGPHLSYQTIEVSLDEELVIFHQLVEGVATSSYAANTAREAGLPESVVQRSLQIEDDLKRNRPISVQKSAFRVQKLNKYLSVYEAFQHMDVSPCPEEVERFMALVKEVARGLN